MLWIQHPSELRRESKEVGVELVDPVNYRRAPHIRRICQHLIVNPGSPKLLL